MIESSQLEKRWLEKLQKIARSFREVSQFKLALLSVANLTPPPPATFSEKNCGKWRVIRVFAQFFTADFTAA
jgi:hypothetical protein